MENSWQELLNFINGNSTLSGIIASFMGNTLSTTVTDGLKRLFKKKQEKKELNIDDCKQLIKEENLAAILEEIKQLIKSGIVIKQGNEEGDNDQEISGLSKVKKNVDISQNNKKGNNNLTISF